jgi:hypothetical protein
LKRGGNLPVGVFYPSVASQAGGIKRETQGGEGTVDSASCVFSPASLPDYGELLEKTAARWLE